MIRAIAALLSVVLTIVAFAPAQLRAQNTPITSFTPGDLVVMRGGDATHSQEDYSFGEVPAYLDEYTTAGVYVGSYAIPSDVLTLPGISLNSHEGHLNVSTDGKNIDFAGYKAPVDPDNARLTTGQGTGDYYQVGQVSTSGVFTHSSLDATIAAPQYMRAAYSTDGTQMWVASKYNGPSNGGFGGGLEYIPNFGTSGAQTVALQGSTDWRTVQVVGGQLYGGTGSSSVGTHGFYAIGQGAPTTGTPSNIMLNPLVPAPDNSTTGFAFTTLPGTTQPINGVSGTPNVVYITGDPSGTAYIGKLYAPAGSSPLGASSLEFASRIPLGNIGTPEGLSIQADATNSSWVDIFVQTATGIYEAIDKSGTSNGDFGALNFTQIVSTTDDVSFYGLTIIPGVASLPGDVNHDGVVNGLDISDVASHWLKSGTNIEGDANHDGVVNGLDISLIASNWLKSINGSAAASASPVPEPATIGLILSGTACLLATRRRRLRTTSELSP